MIKSILTAALLCATLSYGSFEAVNINPNSVRIGNISGFKKGDVLVPFMGYDNSVLSAAYLIPFGLSELSMQEFLYSGKIFGSRFVIAAVNFGNEYYRETSGMVSVQVYSEGDLEIFPAVKYFALKTELGNKSSFGADVNAYYKLTENLNTVLSVLNIYAHETDNIDIPMTMIFNFEYKTESSFNFYTGVEKDSTYPAIFKTGIEYAPFDFFSVSAGYNFDPQTVMTGFSLEYIDFAFNYGLSYHFDLEYSNSFSVVYEF